MGRTEHLNPAGGNHLHLTVNQQCITQHLLFSNQSHTQNTISHTLLNNKTTSILSTCEHTRHITVKGMNQPLESTNYPFRLPQLVYNTNSTPQASQQCTKTTKTTSEKLKPNLNNYKPRNCCVEIKINYINTVVSELFPC